MSWLGAYEEMFSSGTTRPPLPAPISQNKPDRPPLRVAGAE
jgi:hypothetical protein